MRPLRHVHDLVSQKHGEFELEYGIRSGFGNKIPLEVPQRPQKMTEETLFLSANTLLLRHNPRIGGFHVGRP